MGSQNLYDDWSGNVVKDATIRNLDPEAMAAARAVFETRYPERREEATAWDDETFLSKVGVFKRGKVTNAALILLGKSGDRMLPSSVCIRWRLLDHSSAVVDSRVYDGPAVLAIRQAISLIRNPSCRVPSGDRMREVGTYRLSTLIEAVNNAVMHQDYALGGTVDIIERESESVTVVSRGQFPAIPPESFVSSRPTPPPCRNAFLARAMAALGMVTGGCTGIRNMYLSQAFRHFPLPTFSTLDGTVSVTFPGIRGGPYAHALDHREDLNMPMIMDLDRLAKNLHVHERRLSVLERKGIISRVDGLPCIVVGWGPGTVSRFTRGSDADAVLDLISENGSVTRADVVAVLRARDDGASTDRQLSVRATNLLQSLRRDGAIEKSDGNTKSARYVATGMVGDGASRNRGE